MTNESLNENQKIYITEKNRLNLFQQIEPFGDYSKEYAFSSKCLERYCSGNTGLSDYAYSHIRKLLKKEFKEYCNENNLSISKKKEEKERQEKEEQENKERALIKAQEQHLKDKAFELIILKNVDVKEIRPNATAKAYNSKMSYYRQSLTEEEFRFLKEMVHRLDCEEILFELPKEY